MTYTSPYPSPLGMIRITADGEGITELCFKDKKSPAGMSKDAGRDFCAVADAKRWLDIYFSGREPDFTPPLHLEGSDFRLEVWEILRDIPYGETVSYGQIADRIAAERGGRMSAQAVGGAVGSNPVSIIVPCHRVIGSDGSLTGYGGGLWRKAALLELEVHPAR